LQCGGGGSGGCGGGGGGVSVSRKYSKTFVHSVGFVS